MTTDSTTAPAVAGPSAFSSLRKAFVFMRPYRKQIFLATVALVFTAAVTLALVQFVRVIVDVGFVAGSSQSLGLAIAGFLVVAIIQAFGTFARFYWVSWLGERVTRLVPLRVVHVVSALIFAGLGVLALLIKA